MAAAPLTLEHTHSVDAPFATFKVWFDGLELGLCMTCGTDAYAGRTGWWHTSGARLCPDRGKPGRRIGFSPDPVTN